NEIAGALSGLTQVCKFHQDDGHIFCACHQVEGEIEHCLSLIGKMYKMFGCVSYEFALSTHPENYLGEIAEWDEAEAALKDALNNSGWCWVINKGDGAFYGPKIDVHVQDVLGRKHQTATIQLDLQLPQWFQLKYCCGSLGWGVDLAGT
ncbi:threonyl-tRNA synthetase, partial [Coemansia sp. RSA 1972]